ncbi:hypothetical protein [Endozoicomonas arenosclerae]|uniref:hypothetical protein n=1 Tax=Endozoicomonas arenosclerae TaxID=1633495 RepID=UPI000783D0F5|nr:hypothetical protein [Endozoicomonas arenosclerae]
MIFLKWLAPGWPLFLNHPVLIHTVRLDKDFDQKVCLMNLEIVIVANRILVNAVFEDSIDAI